MGIFLQAGEVQGLRFSSPGFRRLRFLLQCPQLGSGGLRCRMDEPLLKIYVLMSDRRFVVFPGRLDDISLSANKVKITRGGKKKSHLSWISCLPAPEVQEFVSHLCSYKNIFLEQCTAKRGFPEGDTHTVCSTNRLSWQKITQRSTGFTPTLPDYKNETKRKKALGRFGRAGIGRVKRKSAGGSSSSIPAMPERGAGWIQAGSGWIRGRR